MTTNRPAPNHNTIEQYGIEVCLDCLFLIANGEGTDEHADLIDAIWPPSEKWHLSIDGDETFFSWSACDGCGSTLGGDRIEATAWRYTILKDIIDNETETT